MKLRIVYLLALSIGWLLAPGLPAVASEDRPNRGPDESPYALSGGVARAASMPAPAGPGPVACPYSFAPMEITGGGTSAAGGPVGDEKLYGLVSSITWLSQSEQSTGGDYSLDAGFHKAAYGPVTCIGSSGIDCNNNGIDDECDIAAGFSLDRDGNCKPDECDDCVTGLDLLANACRIDCQAFSGACVVTGCGESSDADGNGLPDECDPDCDGDGIPNAIDEPTFRFFVDADAAGADDGSSWEDAFTDLQDAICAARGLQPYCTLATCNTCAPTNANDLDTDGDVDDAISVEIWVAEGTYTPAASDREEHFRLTTCVGLYGGFAGSETERNQRNPQSNPTILSGDLLGDDAQPNGNAENSFHVIDTRPEGQIAQDSSAILSGFIISGGNANGANLGSRVGGGMIAFAGSPTVDRSSFQSNFALLQGGAVGLVQANTSAFTDCDFLGNTAQQGGALSAGNSAAIMLSRCLFENNTAVVGTGGDSGSGGAFYAQQNSTPVIIDSTFRGNQAERNGGAIFNSSSTTRLINAAIVDNNAGFAGGGIYNTNSHISVHTSTIADNNADNTGGTVSAGGGIANENSNPSIVNSIVWGNTATAIALESAQISDGSPGVSYALVEGLDSLDLPISGNFDADPMFADLPGGNVQLVAISPAIDRGDRFQLPLDPYQTRVGVAIPLARDLAGAPRVSGPELDPGPYEQFACSQSFALDPDWANFVGCESGPVNAIESALCACYDLNDDDQISVLDYAEIQFQISNSDMSE